ncbi:MAG: GAF domain-containing protein [Cyanosarcina radialis HA8281-LM2]|nr:GAF domain-containing protein [Cyanosarcina radialis HA8281-LM2]
MELRELDWQYLFDKPIHLCGNIQPHGVFLVLEEPDFKILRISNNTTSILGINPEELLGENLIKLLGGSQIKTIEKLIKNDDFNYQNFIKLRLLKEREEVLMDGIIHRNVDNLLILELEPYSTLSQQNDYLSYYHLVKASTHKLQTAPNLQSLCDLAVREVRKFTGFDRVMIYKFDRDWHGWVMSEEKRKDLESFLDLHYPEEDTRQCRPIFSSGYVRLIPDINLLPVEILGQSDDGNSINLSASVLRGVSPCHVEYLKNMGSIATLVMPLLDRQQLWGLVSCHHYSPKYLPYEAREAVSFLGRLMSAELANKEVNEEFQKRVEIKTIQFELLESLSKANNLLQGLVENQTKLLDLVDATGAVICIEENCILLGETPSETELGGLLAWLEDNVESEVFETHLLSSIYPGAEQIKDVASGLLLISISEHWKNYIIWFRQELIQTISWAGDRHQAITKIESEGSLRLSPRGSFAKWQEIVKGQSLPWQDYEIGAAENLRNTLVKMVLRRAEELAQLVRDLQLSKPELEKLAAVSSSDLQQPLNLLSSYVRLLEMYEGDRLDENAKEYIYLAIAGVKQTQSLIDDLLTYSQVNTREHKFQLTAVEKVLNAALANLQQPIAETSAVITRDPLPTIMADAAQLRQIFQNLISNSIKFRSNQAPAIHIGVKQIDRFWQFSVKDNGIGIDPQWFDRLFIPFQRLHPPGEYPGNGIGLAMSKKAIERHQGRIWVESQPGAGATFYFTIAIDLGASGEGGE